MVIWAARCPGPWPGAQSSPSSEVDFYQGRILLSLLLKPSPSKIIICISLVFFISEGFTEARLLSFIITLEVSFFTC